jgi:hypothetical protein
LGQKITIEVEELDKLRKEILSLKSQISLPQTTTTKDLTRRERVVFEYISKYPGTIKERVIDSLVKDGEGSRVTILNTIKDLEKYGMIIIRKDKPNSQIHKLYVNNENVLIAVSQQLDNFKKNFFSLLDETQKKIRKKYPSRTALIDKFPTIEKTGRVGEVTPILHEALIIYQQMIGTFIFHAILKLPRENKDNETFNRLNTIFFSNMIEIQKKISKVFFSIAGTYAVDEELITWRDYFWHVAKTSSNSPLPLLTGTTIKTFKNYGLEKELEPVLDSLNKIKF